MRYWVLPQRPAGTEGLDEKALAALVTREAMIGTGMVAAL
jgi:nitrile hydratase